MVGPYREYVDPGRERERLVRALLSTTRRELRRSKRIHNALQAVGMLAYLVAAYCAGAPREGAARAAAELHWAPLAAAATYVVVCAARAGAEVDRLEAELAHLERFCRRAGA